MGLEDGLGAAPAQGRGQNTMLVREKKVGVQKPGVREQVGPVWGEGLL